MYLDQCNISLRMKEERLLKSFETKVVKEEAKVMCICILPMMPPAPKSTNKWFIGSVGPFAFMVAGPLAKQRGNYWVTVVSIFTLGASIFALAFKLILLAGLLIGAGFGLGSVVLLGAVMKKVGSTEGGAASSTYFTGYDIGMMLSFFTGNVLVQQSTHSPIMWSVYLIPLGLALGTAQRYRSLF